MAKILKYTGTALKTRQLGLDSFQPSKELINAINLALFLKRPLLVMGEPGCGKTRLAEAVAFELHGENFKKHLFEWNIKSTSKAQEGIYQINYLQRLQDANFKKTNTSFRKGNLKNNLSISKYIDYGVMYNAHIEAQNGDIPNVLLIDEIDKADIDFPNDLLLELDKKVFFIPELGKDNDRISAKSDVLVIITSNQEKELPPAFLRRCLFHYIDFPKREQLAQIISQRFGNDEKDVFVDEVITAFETVRSGIEGTDKKPSTSELLNWFEILNYAKELERQKTRSKEEEAFVTQLALLGSEKVPFKQILLKNHSSFMKGEENDGF